MKFSEAWLRQWVNPDLSTEALVERLTLAGLEVDSVESAAPPFDGVRVAKVLSVEPHPKADRLQVCQVDVGDGSPLTVVCGAPNVREGLLAPLAMVGARLPAGAKIERAKLQGVESFGMLCSAAELELAEQSVGLLELSEEASPGDDLHEFLQLDDVSIEIDLTPNRSDCLSVAGIAREVGVLTQSAVTKPDLEPVPAKIEDTFPITVMAPEACPRYLGRVLRGVNPQAQTPWWLRERLRRSGIRSLGLVVDITNYVMLELGQPMHAFDLEQLEGGIQVRYGRPGESLTLLDGTHLQLAAETLVIADQQRALALAGIMGGEESGISDQTQHLFLESAFFNPTVIAGRARLYGLHTDSSHRFERGVDPELPRRAMERATALLIEIAGGQAGPIIEVVDSSQLPPRPTIILREARIRRVLGVEIAESQITEQLTRLGLEVERIAEGWRAKVPSFRFDLALEIDLIEELGRLHGYDGLPSTRPVGQIRPMLKTEAGVSVSRIREVLVDRGYQEAITYSFVDPKLQQWLDPEGTPVALNNPISTDMAVMRTTLWSGLIQALRYNVHRQQERIRLFEYGLTFNGQLTYLKQERTIAGLVSGACYPEQWGVAARPVDFFDLKGDVEALLGLGGQRDCFEFVAEQHPALHPGQSARIVREGRPVGWVGALHPALEGKLDLGGHVYLFALQVEAVECGGLPAFQSLSKFPAIRRDIAFLVSKNIPAQAVFDCLKGLESDILKEFQLFDVYTGKGVDPDKKSLALRLILQHPSYTLTDDKVNAFMERVVTGLTTELGAIIRE
ncbi:phenylalanyl-tRNA synthetase, beta subunit [Nitrosococcus halophilus Nc 4]|uniref:Phenylalanine--tRNA ligase beta subunit n=1 Tax=Nitrosococcus halophilus (strain Nc4) TaxID=472759 RepID=D5C007_NITHN|nr:phenylalanine--tRNA ligase subunit beta [Nitrosococcus halophilus]ADE16254.1 phenylalanyl-tRNA synthetase, beta subunit [Nitrosococcus halophilus Nc 4]